MKSKKPKTESKNSLDLTDSFDKMVYDQLQNQETKQSYIKTCLKNGDSPEKIEEILKYYKAI